jgi:hypothetical protein
VALACTSVTHVLPVPDAEAGRAWYARLLGREPDLIPAPSVYEWRLTDAAWLRIATGTPAPGQTGQILRLGVTGLDRAVEEFVEFGGLAAERIEIPDLITVQDLLDPFSNRLSFYEEAGFDKTD